MALKTKILIAVLGLAIISIVGFIIYNQHQITKRQEAIQNQITQMKTLPDGTQRAETHWATKEDLDAIAKQNSLNMQAIREDLKGFHATVTAINVVSSKSNQQVANNIPSTSTTPNPNPSVAPPIDMFGYFNNRQVLQLNENFNGVKVPIGDVGFSSWQEKPWDINLQSREYRLITVLGTDENSKQYAYNKFIIKINDKEYPVKISNNTFTQEYPMPKFNLNPRLYLGIGGGLNVNDMRGEGFPDVSFGLLQYGKTKRNPDLNFALIGIGYGIDARRPMINITPIAYNVGQHIPLMQNLSVGPVVGVATTGDVTVGLGLRLGM